MFIPREALKSVAFACYLDKSGRLRYAGTVFFMLDYYEPGNLNGFYATVTAKHVIVNIARDSIDQIVRVRLNLKNGDIKYVEFPVSEWKYHPSPIESVDVAVYDGAPNLEHCDISHTTIDMAVTPEMITQNYIGVGDEVFIVGLFVKHTGAKRNLPIIRTGNIAMLTDVDEPVATRDFGDIEGYLIESRSIGGLSGSPVFVCKEFPIEFSDGSHRRLGLGRDFYLLGLIHGHYDVTPQEDALVEDNLKREAINMGIAIVVPASKIMEAIHRPEIMARNEEERQKRRAKLPPTEDSALS